jgi:type III pantothenate kinase
MTELLVDIGNTRLKWCLHSAAGLTGLTALPHRNGQIPGLQEAWMVLPRPEVVRVASVAGAAIGESVAMLALRLWSIGAIFERPRSPFLGLTLAYAEPERLGVDRWLAMLAARHRTVGPLLVVDCGTAVTLDAVDATGQHLGGLILPGISALGQTLFHSTGISPVSLPSFPHLLGRNTNECIAAGALQAVVGVIQRVNLQLAIQGNKPHLILSGGDAARVAEQLEYVYEYVPELVLEGLALVGGQTEL